MRLVLLLAAVVAMACVEGRPKLTGPRYVSETDHFSTMELAGWTESRELGATVFHDPNSRATIAVRAVIAEGDWVEERTPELVVPATEQVLRALPKARVKRLDDPIHPYTSAAFEVSFVPPDKRERYERQHVILFGNDGHLFHLIHTAPAGDLRASAAEFASMIATFAEES